MLRSVSAAARYTCKHNARLRRPAYRAHSHTTVARPASVALKWIARGGSVVAGSLIMAGSAVVFASGSRAEVIQDADRFYDRGDFTAIHDLLEPLKAGGDDEVLWRLARALYELAKASPDAQRAGALLRECVQVREMKRVCRLGR
ncbi:uncharacterized protein LOC108677616 [Hyalella azteca]|uniref:Uncharacterized protein LOC108677616 n=1 Tax=Hyalella azteca TaxID=294128 RepID=A0A8B7P616_HYAAZ|nr:uncharacterized protein LOC108677616 [Hyalella azteca]